MEKILIVEDDPHIAELVSMHLIDAGCQVTVESDGLAGHDRALRETFNLLILDINLPEMSGYDICTQVRQNLTKEESVVIAISAEGEEALKDMKNHGADDVLLKPFTAEQLVSKLKKYLHHDDSRQIGKAS